MQVLLEAPEEEFFTSAKETKNKNKSAEQLSPYTKEFFRVFLINKKIILKPTDWALFRPYNGMNNKLGPWPNSS